MSRVAGVVSSQAATMRRQSGALTGRPAGWRNRRPHAVARFTVEDAARAEAAVGGIGTGDRRLGQSRVKPGRESRAERCRRRCAPAATRTGSRSQAARSGAVSRRSSATTIGRVTSVAPEAVDLHNRDVGARLLGRYRPPPASGRRPWKQRRQRGGHTHARRIAVGAHREDDSSPGCSARDTPGVDQLPSALRAHGRDRYPGKQQCDRRRERRAGPACSSTSACSAMPARFASR